MVALKKYDIDGKEIGEEIFAEEILKKTIKPQAIKDYLVALRNNKRQWSANTKGRREVNVTGAKPHRQKGTGRARQGCFAAPQYRGGGIVFGPKPKFDQHVRINKKEKNAVIRSLLIEKINNSALVLKIDDKEIKKTKQIANFFNNLEILDKRVLIITKQSDFDNFKRCMRNISKKKYVNVVSCNGYDIALCQNLIIMDSVIGDIKEILTKYEKK